MTGATILPPTFWRKRPRRSAQRHGPATGTPALTNRRTGKQRRCGKRHRGALPRAPALPPAGGKGTRSRPCRRPRARREITPPPGPQGERRALHPQRRRDLATPARPTAEPLSPMRQEPQGCSAVKRASHPMKSTTRGWLPSSGGVPMWLSSGGLRGGCLVEGLVAEHGVLLASYGVQCGPRRRSAYSVYGKTSTGLECLDGSLRGWAEITVYLYAQHPLQLLYG